MSVRGCRSLVRSGCSAGPVSNNQPELAGKCQQLQQVDTGPKLISALLSFSKSAQEERALNAKLQLTSVGCQDKDQASTNPQHGLEVV